MMNSQCICKHILFFAMLKSDAEKNKKSLQANVPDSADLCAYCTRQNFDQTEARTGNTGLAKVAVQFSV